MSFNTVNRILLSSQNSKFNNELQHAFDRLSDIEVTLSIFMDSISAAELQEDYNAALVVAESEEEVVDRIQLLNQKQASLPVYLVCAPQLETAVLNELKIAQIMFDPLPATEVVETISKQLQDRTKGQLRGLNLTSVLQLINMEQKSCTVVVKKTTERGELHMYAGEIIAATLGSMGGLEAAYSILGWDNVDIELLDCRHSVTHEIDQPFTSLMMEAMCRKDENSVADESLPVDFSSKKTVDHREEQSEKLADILRSFPEVVEFSLFNSAGKMTYAHGHRVRPPVAGYPEQLEQTAGLVSEELRLGQLTLMTINEADSLSYLFFSYENSRIAVGLRKNQAAGHFLMKFTAKAKSIS
ncbi:DUF4388 domain-containing protein [Desulfuromonas acetoxidans]|uniref:PatA-like N-terminal domain-containing protein n=1 Tax=Desulfuromonas acetoxidans (strain DSM 684 / 11070) TaxID=281689 RepID=Q1JX67_DESA6|nr:DUF4388 domain-containing protein [Desulfuromonas acetoxidans]EAT14795.1 hypothetical protein Dace_0934 [Desulfuromonas acetoxidans DSM 684]MBF0645288.1 DUF4388 domain-containing protein [Desulfuromonas acetoxidans]NVD25594.1 DUF4388 domain-containing protein [Desulfuromonas acetoxidans]NVE17596.1 DUF4388 domain-containing protein [Desulfuromonas acetoxidans]